MTQSFLPISKKDLEARGWKDLDIILISGDAYVDHPSYGTAIIGRVLEAEGFKVGILAQPDWKSSADFLKLGRPRLFFGITAGNLDSTLSNYTINRKIRRKDFYSPGGKSGLRPNRATIVYANRVRECFPDTPIVLGGIEASLTRLAHYHYWTEDVRRSLLLDAKADLLVYGMGEKPIVEIAHRLAHGESAQDLEFIAGTVILRNNIDRFENAVKIPSYEDVCRDKNLFNEAFRLAYLEQDPHRGKIVIQPHANRYVVQFPPAAPMTPEEIDRIYELTYQRRWHPVYDKAGGVPGFETVRFSIVSHRGCSAECSFCSIYAHQGRIMQSRSKASILREVKILTQDPAFKGTISDIGGPTANLYEASCAMWESIGACRDKQCLLPEKCKSLKLGYDQTVDLWDSVMKVPGVKHLFIASGLRYDLLTEEDATEYLKKLCAHHVGGQLKVAPEHLNDRVLKLMRKPMFHVYEKFKRKFEAVNRELKKDQYLVNYFISAHPGSSLEEAKELALYFAEHHMQPEQIQDFIPLPMTISAAMHYTGRDPFTGEAVHVARDLPERMMQRALIQHTQPQNEKWVRQALQILGRPDLEKTLLRKVSSRGNPRAHSKLPEDLGEADSLS